MSSEPQATKLAPDLLKGVASLARALVAATRIWTLYPPDHPAVQASFERLSQAIQDAANHAIFSIGVTPGNLMIEGFTVPDNPQVIEAARLLHDRDLFRLTFTGRVPPDAVAKLQASGRLAQIFDFGQSKQFKTIWNSMHVIDDPLTLM